VGLWLPEAGRLGPEYPYVAINMVASLDGRVASGGRANDLGGRADRRVMRNLRSNFDAVLRGANTLRAEKISAGVTPDLARARSSRGIPAHPAEILLTRSGDVPLGNLLGADPDRTFLLVPETRMPHTPRPERAAVLRAPTTPDGDVDLDVALRLLRRLGHARLLAEGGPTVNRALLSRGLVDEIFLTVAPKLIGDPHAPGVLSGPRLPKEIGATIASVHLAGQELFLRYGLRPVRTF
jgi:2,5-diamino-6-(ribosylamino)-4(3H)-pyrimidinone 5'-phosphate reductase